MNQHPDNLGTTLKHVIYNELGQQRNSNNMAILQVIFQIEPENAAKVRIGFSFICINSRLSCLEMDYWRYVVNARTGVG